jgi:hypothetical protein
MNTRVGTTTRVLLVFTAIVIAAIGVLGTFFPTVIYKAFPRTQPPASKLSTLTINDEQQILTAGPIEMWTSELIVNYPDSMLEDETKTIEVSYSSRTETHDIPNPYPHSPSDIPPAVLDVPRGQQELDTLSGDVTISLTSSGFHIEPANVITRKFGTPLPARGEWTVTPIALGNRDLLLKIDDRAAAAGSGVTKSLNRTRRKFASINGQPVNPDKDNYYQLPVQINNFWGVSQRLASIVEAALALAAFILGYPLVEKLLKGMFFKSEIPEGDS